MQEAGHDRPKRGHIAILLSPFEVVVRPSVFPISITNPAAWLPIVSSMSSTAPVRGDVSSQYRPAKEAGMAETGSFKPDNQRLTERSRGLDPAVAVFVLESEADSQGCGSSSPSPPPPPPSPPPAPQPPFSSPRSISPRPWSVPLALELMLALFVLPGILPVPIVSRGCSCRLLTACAKRSCSPFCPCCCCACCCCCWGEWVVVNHRWADPKIEGGS